MLENKSTLVTSYGPFSITLEGFDDPFPVMKAIADFMCDLVDEETLSDVDMADKSQEITEIAKQISEHHVGIDITQTSIVLQQKAPTALDAILDGSFLEQREKQSAKPAQSDADSTDDQPLFGAKRPVYKTTPPKSEDVDINAILTAIARSKSEKAAENTEKPSETSVEPVQAEATLASDSFVAQPEDIPEPVVDAQPEVEEIANTAIEDEAKTVESFEAEVSNEIDDEVSEPDLEELIAEVSEENTETLPKEDVKSDKPARAFFDVDQKDNAREDMVTRIFHKTNRQLDAPETGRRQSALAHLKAAVVVTSADREAGVPVDDNGEELDHYREDLAHVFDEAAEDEKKTAGSPLQLIEADRVDGSGSIRKPLSPSRVATNLFSKVSISKEDAEGFSTYISDIKGLDLADLIEAAGAYTAYVQGLDHFTRPLVLKYVALLNGKDGFSREEGLCAFGQLLREGKIYKLSGGQYTISEKTRFKPQQQRLAGE